MVNGPGSPDLIADTVELLQARNDEGDRDALRGTMGPLHARPAA